MLISSGVVVSECWFGSGVGLGGLVRDGITSFSREWIHFE